MKGFKKYTRCETFLRELIQYLHVHDCAVISDARHLLHDVRPMMCDFMADMKCRKGNSSMENATYFAVAACAHAPQHLTDARVR